MTYTETTFNGTAYLLANGTYYNKATPGAVVRALESARASGGTVRLFYGDAITGRAWAEENDVSGTVGRSMGPLKVPLLVPHGSRGGGAILSHCIVAIKTAAGFIYKHTGFDPGEWSAKATTTPPHHPEYGTAEVYQDGTLYARVATLKSAERLASFMRGDRLAR